MTEPEIGSDKALLTASMARRPALAAVRAEYPAPPRPAVAFSGRSHRVRAAPETFCPMEAESGLDGLVPFVQVFVVVRGEHVPVLPGGHDHVAPGLEDVAEAGALSEGERRPCWSSGEINKREGSSGRGRVWASRKNTDCGAVATSTRYKTLPIGTILFFSSPVRGLRLSHYNFHPVYLEIPFRTLLPEENIPSESEEYMHHLEEVQTLCA